jgi:DNA primase large subunit
MAAFLLKACTTANLVLHGNEYGARNLREVEQERRRDHLSHFILRLAFCGNPENMRWFVNNETVLMRTRYEKMASGDRSLYVNRNTTDCPLLSREQRMEIINELAQVHGPHLANTEEFFVVPWHAVPDLVGRRGVFLRRGFAFVPRSEAFSIILARFREQLDTQMERTAKELPGLRDDRILPLLDLIRKAEATSQATGGDAARGFVEGGVITADQVDAASAHFPPCMQHLHRALRQNSHLKYNGRQQYGLYLKSIGLSLEEALAFWRRSFASKVGEDKFQKEYAYNVRHNYGQEGKRANYAPFSCSKIITGGAPGVGDHHGCPFRHHNQDSLRSYLTSYQAPNGNKLTRDQADVVLDLVQGHHHQLACTKLFELTRKTATPLDTITYPSKFYELSIQESKK